MAGRVEGEWRGIGRADFCRLVQRRSGQGCARSPRPESAPPFPFSFENEKLKTKYREEEHWFERRVGEVSLSLSREVGYFIGFRIRVGSYTYFDEKR